MTPALEAIILKLLSGVPVERFKGSVQRAAEALEQAAERGAPETEEQLLVAEAGRFVGPVGNEEVPQVEPPKREGELKPVKVQALVPAPRPPRPEVTARWGPWHTLTALGIVLILVTAREPLYPFRDASAPHGGSGAVGDSGAVAPGASRSPRPTAKSISLNMPKGPLNGQRRPPCDEDDYEIRGGCWHKLEDKPPKCSPKAYEWQGGCYKPHYPPPREPTSDSP